LLAVIGSALAEPKNSPSSRLLPTRAGDFRQVSTYFESSSYIIGPFGANYSGAEFAEFKNNNGISLSVELVGFAQDADAYEFLSLLANQARQTQSDVKIQTGLGTAGFVTESKIAFFKGTHVVTLRASKPLDAATLEAVIAELSANLDKGESDIPALVKHVPNADEARFNGVFLHNFGNLSELGFQSAVFSAVDAEAGRNADAVLATYGPSKVVIVEFNTPQLALEYDHRIIARIQELWKLGQAAPTAYRRVGNYSVFVFDAPDEQTAKQLIAQVKYEQVVQWLGENPNILKDAQRRYVNTTLGVLVTVLKASGYALLTCLGMGGLIGGLLFSYRRSQQKAVTAFSDAGGMLRLNLDELTAETDAGRLLRERN
jgi:hypothetical protein